MVMSLFPIGSFDDAFWAGEAIGFIEDNTRVCCRCGRDLFYGEYDCINFDGGDDLLCPRCHDDYDLSDEDDDFG